MLAHSLERCNLDAEAPAGQVAARLVTHTSEAKPGARAHSGCEYQ